MGKTRGHKTDTKAKGHGRVRFDKCDVDYDSLISSISRCLGFCNVLSLLMIGVCAYVYRETHTHFPLILILSLSLSIEQLVFNSVGFYAIIRKNTTLTAVLYQEGYIISITALVNTILIGYEFLTLEGHLYKDVWCKPGLFALSIISLTLCMLKIYQTYNIFTHYEELEYQAYTRGPTYDRDLLRSNEHVFTDATSYGGYFSEEAERV